MVVLIRLTQRLILVFNNLTLHAANKTLGGLETGEVVGGNHDSGVLRNVAGGLLGAVLHNKTAKSSQVNILFVEKTDGSNLDLIHTNDPAFTTSDAKGQALDLDFGLRYTYKKLWYAGASVMHMMGQTISLGDEKKQEVTVDPVIYLTGGYRYKMRYPRYALAMDAILRSDLQNWRGDITARLEYDGEKHKLYGGIMYSPMNSVGILLGYNFHGINIGYSYEVYTGGIGVQNGTHEIMIGYQTDLNLGKKGKNLHKSVRLL